MNDQDSFIRADVDRGLAIAAELVTLQDELEQIETRLQAAGLDGEQIELNDPDREGRQFIARGSEKTVPVVFTADLLVGQFQDASAVHNRISEACGEGTLRDRAKRLRNFFAPKLTFTTLFDSGKKFRAKAAEIFGKDAPTFISACLQRDKDGIPKSKVRIEWQRAEQITAGDQQ
jgi:hypothetical protein